MLKYAKKKKSTEPNTSKFAWYKSRQKPVPDMYT